MTPQPTPSASAAQGLGQWPAVPMLASGLVRHTRLRPTHHAFAYRACSLWLPMRTLSGQPEQLAAAGLTGRWMQFDPRDHGDGSPHLSALVAWVDGLLQAQGIDAAERSGELWLQCFPRMLGHAFKPVSFWHALGPDGEVRASVAEVNNTFGERHCYVLERPRWGRTQWADKVFHVSPFCTVQGRYAFRFLCTQRNGQAHSVVRIDHDDPEGALLQTSLSATLSPATPAAVLRAFWQHPVHSWAVTARIHWQALRLWLKGVSIHSKPAQPFASRP